MSISWQSWCNSVHQYEQLNLWHRSIISSVIVVLQWLHNERDGVSNHQRLECLLNRLFRCRAKKTPKLRFTGLCEGNSPVADEFPALRASNGATGWVIASNSLIRPRFHPCPIEHKTTSVAVFVMRSIFWLAWAWQSKVLSIEIRWWYFSRWHHQMETFSASLALCAGNSPVTGEFPSQRPVTRSFDVFVDMRLSKRLSKQSKRRWFETPSHPLWRHCNVRKAWDW